MDMFGSSDDEGDAGMQSCVPDIELQRKSFYESLCNLIYVECMKLRSKAPIHVLGNTSDIINKEIIIVGNRYNNMVTTEWDIPMEDCKTILMPKLAVAKIKHVTFSTYNDYFNTEKQRNKYDIVIFLSILEKSSDIDAVTAKLMPKGYFIGISKDLKLYSDNDWLVDTATSVPILSHSSELELSNLNLVCIPKRAAHFNQAGALYWPDLLTSEHIAQEKQWIEKVSVTLYAQEVSRGVFSSITHDSATKIMLDYGVCIFPQIFPAQEVQVWGEAARADMKEAIQKLRARFNVDLLASAEDVSIENVVKDNFHELSMREAYRCDLRNSPCMQRLHAALPAHLPTTTTSTVQGNRSEGEHASVDSKPAPSTAGVASTVVDKISAAVDRCIAQRSNPSLSTTTTTTSTTTKTTEIPNIPPAPELRYHRGLLGVLTEIMNPIAQKGLNPDVEVDEEVNIEHGNWGKWNFNGPGPGTFNSPCIGKMGTVVSLPGCKDQTIHADTAHIFEHTHLPAHYLNFFIPCIFNNNSSNNHTIQLNDLKPNDPSRAAALVAAATEAKRLDPTLENETFIDEETLLRDILSTGKSKTGSSTSTQSCYYQGQTAFVIGSHQMKIAATTMTHPDYAQSYLESRLIRPQLSTGDALLFDCRILHFGVSNWSHLKKQTTSTSQPSSPLQQQQGNNTSTKETKVGEDWRLMMYINYHQHWFQDPKNWNDAAKLF